MAKKTKKKTSGKSRKSKTQRMQEEQGKRKSAANEFDRCVREACAQYASIDRARVFVWDWLSKRRTTKRLLADELIDRAILSHIYEERSRIRREIKHGMVDSVRDNISVRNSSAATRNVLNGVHKQYMLETWPTEFGMWFGELTAPEIEKLRDREASMRDGHGAMVDFYNAVLDKLPDYTTKVSDKLDVDTLAKMMAEAHKRNNLR